MSKSVTFSFPPPPLFHILSGIYINENPVLVETIVQMMDLMLKEVAGMMKAICVGSLMSFTTMSDLSLWYRNWGGTVVHGLNLLTDSCVCVYFLQMFQFPHPVQKHAD